MFPQGQAPLRNFYDDFGTRLAFLRAKRGIPLASLAGGKASTAKSWEQGSIPAASRWEEIAEKLGLSPSFVFLGQPRLREDYDFIAKYGDEIGEPTGDSAVHEPPASYGDPTPPRAATSPPPPVPTRRPVELTPPYRLPPDTPTEQQCLEYLRAYLQAGREVPGAAAHTWLELQEKFPLSRWKKYTEQSAP